MIRHRKEEKMIEPKPGLYPLTFPAATADNAPTQLEGALASYLGYKHLIALNSVDAAFALALSVFEKGSGLLCSPNAPAGLFKAAFCRMLLPQYCDLRLDGTIEPRFLERTKTSNSRAVVVSHHYGQKADCDTIASFAAENQLLLIEDATLAFGKSEKHAANVAIYDLDSLLPAAVAKGGFIATDDDVLAAGLRLKAGGGYEQKRFWNYDITEAESDSRLDSLVASLALDALADIEARHERIREIQRLYLDRLAGNRLIELPDPATLIPHHLFPIALIPALFCPKEDIYEALHKEGVSVKVGNKPIYKTTFFRDETLSIFGAEEVYKAQLLLPCHPFMTEVEAGAVVAALERVLQEYGYRGCRF